MSALLTVRDLSVVMHNQDGDVPILQNVALEIAEGESVALVGESGSGKSTTARAVLRLLGAKAEVSGSVTLCGTSMLDASEAEVRDVRARSVALVQQDPRASLNPVRKIGDSMVERLVLVRGQRRPEAMERAEAALAAVGLTQPGRRLRQYPHELSGGMLQRVVIATGLLADPTLILADEATSALDVTTQAEVLALLQAQQRERGLGMLFITHDLHLAAATCNRVVVMRGGAVIETVRGTRLFEDSSEDYTRALLDAAPRLRKGAA